jgi:hypothetical protein
MKSWFQICLLCVGILVLVSCTKKNNPNYERFNLKGKVKSFKEVIYASELTEDTYQRGSILATTEYNFDETGNNIKNNQYFGSSELFSWSQFTYNNNVLVREDNFDKSGKPLYTTTFKKISEEEIDFERIINTGEKVTSGKNWISHNKVVKSVLNMYNNSVEYEVITINIEYNEKGDIKTRTQTKKNGESETIYFKYTNFDKNGNWTECITYGKEGELEPYNFMTREYVYFGS